MVGKREFETFAGRKQKGQGYDMRTAKASGLKPVYDPSDQKMHWGSRDPKSGMILKARGHPTYMLEEAAGETLGYKIRYDNKTGRYKSQQENSGLLNIKQKPGTNIKIDRKTKITDRG